MSSEAELRRRAMESLLKSRRGASGGEREREGDSRERERESDARGSGRSESPGRLAPASERGGEREGEKSIERGVAATGGTPSSESGRAEQKGGEAGDIDPGQGKGDGKDAEIDLFAASPEDVEMEAGEIGGGVGNGDGDATPPGKADPMEQDAETPTEPAAREDSAAQSSSHEGNGKSADGNPVLGLAHQYYENGDGAGTPAETPVAEAQPKKSKWAEGPPPPIPPPAAAKSKWAEDSPSPDAGAGAGDAEMKLSGDVMSKAAGQADGLRTKRNDSLP
ncbi:hypothetical protein T484DRAFT_1777580 [Baffinella frigidus]|nr:hypothetical protein T484DRAFT_1777580 [Cryptophyta sp. CCMP2293]